MSEASSSSDNNRSVSASCTEPTLSPPRDSSSIKENILVQAADTTPCPTCGAGGGISPPNPSYIYALGRIQPRFPSPSIEKEFRQALGETDTAGQTDPQAMQSSLARRESRYLVRKMCWVLTIEGLETYILQPRDPADFDLLIDALRPSPRPTDTDLVIGLRGPIAPPQLCNGLMVPVVAVDQIYSFDVDGLIRSIPRPEGVREDRFRSTAEELFYRIMQMADNAGATDEHRALNYEAVRDPRIYAHTSEMHGRDFSLSAIEVRSSRLSGTRKIVDVIFSYRNRNTDVEEKYFVRVDVTEEFPFLVTRLSPFYERQ